MGDTADITFWLGIGTVIAGVTAGAIGWLVRRPQESAGPSASISGAAIIDSRAVAGLVDAIIQLSQAYERKQDDQARAVTAMNRQAQAMESILALMVDRQKAEAQLRYDSELETLRREIDQLKRGKR
jgi:hypothetical protein